MAIRIQLSSVFVDDQAKALQFYTAVLGFEKATDLALGEARWLTVRSVDGPPGVELLLEPASNPAAKDFQKAIFEQGIPANAFAVDDVQVEFERLSAAGVVFRCEPTDVGMAVIAILEDTCGNLVQIYATKEPLEV